MKAYRVKSGDVIRYIDLTYDSPSLRRAIRYYFGYSCDFKVVNILNVRQYCIEDWSYLSAPTFDISDLRQALQNQN